MARFTVRVELRNSKDADYDELHKLMEANGFSRTIKLDSGKIYFLPNAEYNYESSTRDKESVANLADSVASQVRAKPKILVTQSAGRYVLNLEKA
ncbi:DUF2622 domain-containing protein [Enterobacter roggenkampii]|uniref:DUF2622 domain-containing protein n=1 Tax=Enterobacter roggenkampii TaxID=1812935 RepID=UPI00277C03EA|nr:type V toxin-antitoxin system endoribonuclease antitoxin GhoS [Enterobacter roggenkampii]